MFRVQIDACQTRQSLSLSFDKVQSKLHLVEKFTFEVKAVQLKQVLRGHQRDFDLCCLFFGGQR